MRPVRAKHVYRKALVTGASSGIGRALTLWLAARGVFVFAVARRSERLNALQTEGLAFVTAFLGCAMAGVVAVPVYPTAPARAARVLPRFLAVVADAAPSIALTTAAFLPDAPPLSAANPRLQWLATDVARDLPPVSTAKPKVDVRGDSLALLQYTSGSTSSPRGVMATHANLLHNFGLVRAGFESSERSVVVSWLPLYHDMGLIGAMLQPLIVGGSLVLMSPLAFLQKPVRWLRAITTYGGTESGGPNFGYDLCVQKIRPADREGLDLRTWTLAFNGAEPVRRDTIDRFTETFAASGFRREFFYPCYGLAEATLIVSGGRRRSDPTYLRVDATALEEHRIAPVRDAARGARTLVGCGRPLEDMHVRIVDPDTRVVCDEGCVGEVWISGPSVARGYWKRENESISTFRARLAGSDEGPYLRTGDLGFMYEEELFITGRLKDMIIVRGRNHYPQDIELSVERCHPGMRPGGVAAFGLEIDGEVSRRLRMSPLGGATRRPAGVWAAPLTDCSTP